MLYGHLEIRANSLRPKQCNKCCTAALGNVSKLPENSTAPSPRFLCLNNSRTDYTKIRTVRTVLSASVSVPFFFLLYEIRKSVQYDLSARTIPCLDFCAFSCLSTTCSIRTVRPAFNVVLVALIASISVLVFYLGMRALALRNGLFLAARKCSCSLSQNETTTQQWVRPPTLIDLMR
jgi:hypothetical protein